MDYKDLNDYELIYQIRENDGVAYNALVTKYSNLVGMLAKKYLSSNKYNGIDYDDLFQEGMLGVLKAIDDYNSNDTLFYTYAALCAKREMEKTLKCANRYKYKSLNESTSLNKPLNNGSNLTLEETIASNFDVDVELLSKDLSYKLIEIKNNLPFKDSMIFELRMNGFNSREISELLDTTKRSIDYHWRKIRKKVRQVISYYR